MTLSERIKHAVSKKQESVLSASLILSITFALSAVLGFLRSRFLYSMFFAEFPQQLDAYNAAFRLPDLIFKLLVSGALSASFIPVFSHYLHHDKKIAFRISSTVINALIILFIVLALIIFIFAYPFSKLITPGFTESQLILMASLTRILIIAQIFFLISNFLTGMIQVYQMFLIPALSPIVYNIFIILGILFLAPTFGIYGVTFGVVIGAFFHMLIQIPLARKLGFRYSTTINLKLSGVKEIIRLLIPRSLSLGLAEIESTVTLFFASTLAVGTVSLFNLALQLMYLPSRIFGSTIGQASLPILSKNIAKNEIAEFRATVNKTILQSLFLALPITTLILVLRLPLVRIAFGAKQFPWSATLITAKTLAFLTPAIVSQAISQILSRSFYAMHNTKTPLHVAFVSLIANVGATYYFVNYTDLGIIGLAISVSLGNLVQFLGLFYAYSKRVKDFEWKYISLKFFKIGLASLFMGFAIWFTVKFMDLFVFDTTKTLFLLTLTTISSVIGLIVYLISCKILKIDEYQDFLRLLKINKTT